MAPSFADKLHTGMCKFGIGPDAKPVWVHRGVIASLSPKLEHLLTSPTVLEETAVAFRTEPNAALFSNLEMQDFDRICEFTFRGDYTVPEPAAFDENDANAAHLSEVYADPIVNVIEDVEPTEDQIQGDREWNGGVMPRGDLAEHFKRREYFPFVQNYKELARGTGVQPNFEWTEDFEPVFLGHARLYAFAQDFDIEKLKSLALHKLHRTLKRFTLYASGICAIVKLVCFAYGLTKIGGRWHGIMTSLQELLVEFMALNIEHFNEELAHRLLLYEQGEYAVDLLHTMTTWR